MQYKAILYYTKFFDSNKVITDALWDGSTKPVTQPADVAYFPTKRYKIAEQYFFEQKEWKQDGNFHIEFEEVED